MLFAGLIITTLLLAEAMIQTNDLRLWLVAGALPAATILGYAISRTPGRPRDNGGDAGNWTGPLDLAFLLMEGVVVLLVPGRLADRRTGVFH